MFLVKALWAIYFLVQVECLLQGTYFSQEEMTVGSREAIKQIPNASKIACALACKQEPRCKESGLSKDGTCYLFGGKVDNTEQGDTVIVLKEKIIFGPDSVG